MFFAASASFAYPMLTSIFEVFEVPYFQRETDLQFPGHRHTVDEPALIPEEFVAEENVNFHKDVSK